MIRAIDDASHPKPPRARRKAIRRIANWRDYDRAHRVRLDHAVEPQAGWRSDSDRCRRYVDVAILAALGSRPAYGMTLR